MEIKTRSREMEAPETRALHPLASLWESNTCLQVPPLLHLLLGTLLLASSLRLLRLKKNLVQ